MRPRARTLLAVVATGLAGSQLGHALTYALSFGPEALRRQSGGSHAYFPGLLGTILALSAAALGVVVLLAVLARMPLVRAAPGRPAPGRPLLQVIGALLLVQLCVFAAQELAEAAAASALLVPAPGLLAAGLAGQFPVAVAGAVALTWLSRELGQALRALRQGRLLARTPGCVTVPAAHRTRPRRLRTDGAVAGWSERGPPAFR